MKLLLSLTVSILLTGCLLFIPPPDIELIEDKTVKDGEELSMDISASDPRGREVTFTYADDGGGWINISGNTLKHTFETPGQHTVTSFTVTVKTPQD